MHVGRRRRLRSSSAARLRGGRFPGPEAASEDVDLESFICWATAQSERGSVVDSFEELLERAGAAALPQARELIARTGQDDLLEILEEYEEIDCAFPNQDAGMKTLRRRRRLGS